ncbi:MAG TPA: hypothetical protein DIC34_06755 [Treponema sp.]|nr:hypothetical protein [Treponema sp.]
MPLIISALCAVLFLVPGQTLIAREKTAAEVPAAAAASAPAAAATLYVDSLSLLTGAAVKAVHLRGGFERPVSGALTWAAEGEVYFSSPDDGALAQMDAGGILRLRPGVAGLFLGAGAAAGWFGVYPSGGSGHYSLRAWAFLEAGIRLGKPGGPFYMEPQARACIGGGPDFPLAGGRTIWRGVFGPDFGLRLVFPVSK